MWVYQGKKNKNSCGKKTACQKGDEIPMKFEFIWNHAQMLTDWKGSLCWLTFDCNVSVTHSLNIFRVKKRCLSHLIHKQHTSQYLSVIKYSQCVLMMKCTLCVVSLNILDAWRWSMEFCLSCLWLWCWQRGLISSQGAEEKLCASYALYKRGLVYVPGSSLHQRHPIQCRPGLNMSYFRPVCHQARMAPLAMGCSGEVMELTC